jgi:hypothetical protein
VFVFLCVGKSFQDELLGRGWSRFRFGAQCGGGFLLNVPNDREFVFVTRLRLRAGRRAFRRGSIYRGTAPKPIHFCDRGLPRDLVYPDDFVISSTFRRLVVVRRPKILDYHCDS